MGKFKIVLGSLFLISVLYAYGPQPLCLEELTATSNTLAGIVLIIDGILELRDRKISILMYHMVLCMMVSVYCCCSLMMAFNIANFNFKGGYMFLHSINPIVFLFMYLFTTKLNLKDRKDLMVRMLTAPLLYMAYWVFDLIGRLITGSYYYGFLDDDASVIIVMLFGIIMYVVSVAAAYGLIQLKKYTESKMII